MTRIAKTKKYCLKLSVLTLILLTVAFVGCSKPTPATAGMVGNIEETASMTAKNITTVISDSGITRYRITTPELYIYNNAKRSHWLFPKGLYFERFDAKLHPDANATCKHAIYYNIEKLWILEDSVVCTNIEGDRFETSKLEWDELEEKIFSDRAVKITKSDMVINGVGFESNQTLTKYRIKHVTGIIPTDKVESEGEDNDSTLQKFE